MKKITPNATSILYASLFVISCAVALAGGPALADAASQVASNMKNGEGFSIAVFGGVAGVGVAIWLIAKYVLKMEQLGWSYPVGIMVVAGILGNYDNFKSLMGIGS